MVDGCVFSHAYYTGTHSVTMSLNGDEPETQVYLIHIRIMEGFLSSCTCTNSHVLSNGFQHMLHWHTALFAYIYLFGRCFYPIIQFKHNAGVWGWRAVYFQGRESIWHSRDLLAFIRSVCYGLIEAHITLLEFYTNPSAEISFFFFFNIYPVSLVYNLSSVFKSTFVSCSNTGRKLIRNHNSPCTVHPYSNSW